MRDILKLLWLTYLDEKGHLHEINEQLCAISEDISFFSPSKDGVVLVHCNAGVSRAAAILIGFLMRTEGLNFPQAFSLVKNARPAICPNPGFMEQLHKYQQCNAKTNGNVNDNE